MISAVDTNVLADILIPDAPHLRWAREALDDAAATGSLIVGDTAYAELTPFFPGVEDLDRFLADSEIDLMRSSPLALFEAGRVWRLYTRRRGPPGCPRCGAPQRPACDQCGSSLLPRQHLIADFMIGAHALVHADRLLTRDRGFFAQYFPDLPLETP